MQKPLGTNVTNALNATKAALSEHVSNLFVWRSSHVQAGDEVAAKEAWDQIEVITRLSDSLEILSKDISVELSDIADQNDEVETDSSINVGLTRKYLGKDDPTRIRIRLRGGQIIIEPTAAESLVAFVNLVGPQRVEALGLHVNRQPLVSSKPLPKYGSSSWKPVGDLFIETHSNTRQKAAQVKEIASRLGVSVSIDIVRNR